MHFEFELTWTLYGGSSPTDQASTFVHSNDLEEKAVLGRILAHYCNKSPVLSLRTPLSNISYACRGDTTKVYFHPNGFVSRKRLNE